MVLAALYFNVPPPKLTVPLDPRAPELPSAKTPALTVAPPEKVLAPERVTVPAPVLSNAPVLPLKLVIAPLIVRFCPEVSASKVSVALLARAIGPLKVAAAFAPETPIRRKSCEPVFRFHLSRSPGRN